MAEVAQGTQQEFWRPPSPSLEQDALASDSAPAMAEACPRCGTEFLFGSRFCHTCGGKRPVAISPDAHADAAAVAQIWERYVHHMQAIMSGLSFRKIKLPSLGWVRTPSWLHYLQFHEIKERLGLSTGALISCVIGLACVAGSLLVGLLNAKTLVDWQAIQMYRIEWLLAATASFVAGILLKKSSDD